MRYLFLVCGVLLALGRPLSGETLGDEVFGDRHARTSLAEAEAALGERRTEEARRRFQQVLRVYPGTYWAKRAAYGLAQVRYLEGDFEGASLMWKELLRTPLEPELAFRVFHNLGLAFEAAARYPESLEALEAVPEDLATGQPEGALGEACHLAVRSARQVSDPERGTAICRRLLAGTALESQVPRPDPKSKPKPVARRRAPPPELSPEERDPQSTVTDVVPAPRPPRWRLAVSPGVGWLGYSQEGAGPQRMVSVTSRVGGMYRVGEAWRLEGDFLMHAIPLSRTAEPAVRYLEASFGVGVPLALSAGTTLVSGLGYKYTTMPAEDGVTYGFTSLGGPQLDLVLSLAAGVRDRLEVSATAGLRAGDGAFIRTGNWEAGLGLTYRAGPFGASLDYRHLRAAIAGVGFRASFFEVALSYGFQGEE